MDFLEYFKLGPMTTGGAFFLMWFLGAVCGYCFGRAHEGLIRIRRSIDNVNASVTRLNKGTKNVK